MLGLGNSLIKGGLTGPTIVTDNLVLKHKYDAGGVVPVSDGAAYFGGPGFDDYIDCGAVNLGTSGCSYGGWFWINSTQTDQFATLIGQADWDGDHIEGTILRFNNNDLQMSFGDDTNGANDTVAITNFLTTAGNTNTWKHIYVTLLSGTTGSLTSKLYVDGVLRVTDTNVNFEPNHSTVNLSIGKALSLNTSQSALLGYASNVSVYTTELTQAQIKSIMWKNYAGLSTSEKTNLVSWWNLDGVGYNSDSNNNIARDYVGSIGSELVTNGTFDTDSGWTKTGATIGSGTTLISEDSAYNRVQQTHSETTTTDNFYRLTYDVLSNTFSNTSTGLQLGGAATRYVAANKTIPSTVGSHIYDFKSDNNGGVLVIQINNNTGTGSIKIDNISLKQLSGNNGTLS